MASSVFDLIARLRLDGSNFQAGMTQAQVAASKFGGSLKNSLARFVGGAFLVNQARQFGQEILQNARQIQTLSDKFGITTTEVQQLQAAAGELGQTFEQFTANGETLVQRLMEAQSLQLNIITSEQIEAINTFNMALEETKRNATVATVGVAGAIVDASKKALDEGFKGGALVRFLSRFGQGVFKTGREFVSPPPAPASNTARLESLERLRQSELDRDLYAKRRSPIEDRFLAPDRPGGSRITSDPLTAVGNFLGSSGADSAAERRHYAITRQLDRIVENTEPLKRESVF